MKGLDFSLSFQLPAPRCDVFICIMNIHLCHLEKVCTLRRSNQPRERKTGKDKFSMPLSRLTAPLSFLLLAGTISQLPNCTFGFVAGPSLTNAEQLRLNLFPTATVIPSDLTKSMTYRMMAKSENLGNNSNDKKEKELSPEKVAELIEVSFVNGVMQLAQGYVDVLKLFIAAVQSGYALGMSPGYLLEVVDNCPGQSANRPLMEEEVQLRTTWIQVIYLVLDYVHYKNMHLADLDKDNGKGNTVDVTVSETYAGAIPILSQAHKDGQPFEAEAILELCKDVLPSSANNGPLEKAILLQSLRVIWLSFTALQEEAQCFEDKAPYQPSPDKPQPPIPGAFER